MRDSLLTVAEVASRLKCHPHTVRRWIWSQKLSAVKVGDLIRISEQEVDKLLKPTHATESRRSKRGAQALLSTMRQLKRVVDPDDVELMERQIRASEQSPDWNDPLA